MNGKLLTPQDVATAGMSEMSVGVVVNGQAQPLPVAKLMVLSDIAATLGRIAEVMELWRDQQPWYASQRAAEMKLASVTPIKEDGSDG